MVVRDTFDFLISLAASFTTELKTEVCKVQGVFTGGRLTELVELRLIGEAEMSECRSF